MAKKTGDKPALMKHQDVVTLFHEMGHAFHGLCSETQFAKFHGTAVARDFVEAPSQMLENWMWERDVLKLLSSHYERKGEALDDDTINALIKSKSVNQVSVCDYVYITGKEVNPPFYDLGLVQSAPAVPRVVRHEGAHDRGGCQPHQAVG